MRVTILLAAISMLAAGGGLLAQEPAAPPADAGNPAAAPSAIITNANVVRAILTSGISEREPVDELTTACSGVPLVYFFTELRGLQGQHVTHRWEHDGQKVAEVGFDVKGPRWRVWSSKSMPADTSGSWKVMVVNGAGELLATREFTCGTN